MKQRKINRNAVIECVKDTGWDYKVIADDQKAFVACLEFGDIKKVGDVNLYVMTDKTSIQSFAVCSMHASESDFPTVVEFITRVNYSSKYGKFEFDYNDGEVRYHTIMPSHSGVPSQKDIELIIKIPLSMLLRYGEGLTKCLIGCGDPENDVNLAEE